MTGIARWAISVSTASLLLSAAADAQSRPSAPGRAAPGRGRLIGIFENESGRPLEDVEVTDIFNDVTFRTNELGLLSLAFLPDGRSIVRVRKFGFASQQVFVTISPKDTSPITLAMNRLIELAAVIITDSATKHTSPLLRDFEERRRGGVGHFLVESQLRKEDGRRLGDVLARFAGLTVNGRDGSIRSMRGGCVPDVYIDGVRAPRGSPGVGNLEVNHFAGIEFYSTGEIPIRFNVMSNGCGGLLLWTRDR